MQKIKCLLYTILDWFKQTRLASVLFYYGKRFVHVRPITITGSVITIDTVSSDGDSCFDVAGDDGVRWHCEVTICAEPELRSVASTLKPGQRVRVSGVFTIDPDHHILWIKYIGGHNEIHPVTAIEILPG